MKSTITVMISVLAISMSAACGDSPGEQRGTVTPQAETAAPGDGSTVELSDEIVAGLQWMREEEKVAHDVYVTFGDMYGKQIFFNIVEAETTHTEAVRDMLVKYDIEDPAQDTPIGVFTDPELQDIYDHLVEDGSESETAALRVGAYIEEHDIRDLDDRITDELPDDVATLYASLRMGSTFHLQGFVSNLEKKGIDYEPQILTADEFEAAMSTSQR